MPRTIVYPGPLPPKEQAFRSPSTALDLETEPSTKAVSADARPDEYVDKLAKYVPAEVLAFFAPMAAGLADRSALLFAAAAVGVLATPAYLWRTARDLPREKKPLPHFYVLAPLSFAVWASATTRLGALLGLDQIVTSFLLGATVFLLPLIDDLLTRARRRSSA